MDKVIFQQWPAPFLHDASLQLRNFLLTSLQMYTTGMHQSKRATQWDLGSKICIREESKAKEKEENWPVSSTPFPDAASLDRELIFILDS